MRQTLVALLIALGAASAPLFAAEDPFPHVAQAYLVRVQGETLWARHADARLPPASLTKIMTALLVLESYQPQAVVTVSPAVAAETGARLALRAGDSLRVADLLVATLLRSANDACHALAEWHSGNETAFVARMNRRAAELGLRNTRFQNACGHDAADHYSSARDMALLADTAMRQPEFARLVVLPQAQFTTSDGRRRFTVKNTNALLGNLPGAAGVKSGYTKLAGKCVVALAERAGVRVLVVLFNAPDRWWTAAGLLERAFSAFDKNHGT